MTSPPRPPHLPRTPRRDRPSPNDRDDASPRPVRPHLTARDDDASARARFSSRRRASAARPRARAFPSNPERRARRCARGRRHRVRRRRRHRVRRRRRRRRRPRARSTIGRMMQSIQRMNGWNLRGFASRDSRLARLDRESTDRRSTSPRRRLAVRARRALASSPSAPTTRRVGRRWRRRLGTTTGRDSWDGS